MTRAEHIQEFKEQWLSRPKYKSYFRQNPWMWDYWNRFPSTNALRAARRWKQIRYVEQIPTFFQFPTLLERLRSL